MKLIPIFQANKENEKPIGSLAINDDIAEYLEDLRMPLELCPSFVVNGDECRLVAASLGFQKAPKKEQN